MRKSRTISLVAAAVVATIGALWWAVGGSMLGAPNLPNDPAANSDGASTTPPTDAAPAAQTPRPPASVERPWHDLPPEDVISSPDCRLVAGTGSARDTAVVIAGTADTRFWYAVVDWQGVAFGGFVPFKPSEHLGLGRNPDGAVLVAFRGSGHWAEAWLVRDGQTIYQADEAWHLNVAPDGSSFYSVEPLAGGASRLVIRNLDMREEHHHDLGDILWRTYAGHRVAFSVAHDEVIVHPTGWPHGKLTGTYRFYPVDGGQPRQIRTEDGSQAALFQSSEVGYHVDYQVDSARLSRVNRRFDGTGNEIQSDEAWVRDFPFDDVGRPSCSLSSPTTGRV